MRIHVINLARRPERRAFMQEQADRLGLALSFVEAVDAQQLGTTPIDVAIKPGLVYDRISEGDLACMLSHRKVWREFLASGDRYAAILEDDAILSEGAAAFLTSDAWIEPQMQLIKLERFGRRRKLHALDCKFVLIHSRRLRRFHTKHIGSAGYVISAEAARVLLDETEVVGEPVDQVLFNPSRSAVFRRLQPYILEPAICQQATGVIQSDIRHTRIADGAGFLTRLGRNIQSHWSRARVYLPLVAPLLLKRVEVCPVEFR